MKNLATHSTDPNVLDDLDNTICEELKLSGIPIVKLDERSGEVPTIFGGKIGNWTFRRAWHYWVASTENVEDGLPLNLALELHNKSITSITGVEYDILGKFIRSGGDCTCPSPDGYTSQPKYNEELEEKLIELGYEKKTFKGRDKEYSYIDINCGDVAKLCNEGKLIVERYVDCYHIDEQFGLNEFAYALFNHNVRIGNSILESLKIKGLIK